MPDVRAALDFLRADTRRWAALGLVVEVVVDRESVYLEVDLQPDGDSVLARAVPTFAGAGWGIYHPIAAGDQVLVVMPEGDPDLSPVAIGPLHTETDAVPTEALGEPETWWLVMRPGKHVRIKATGAGRIYLEAPTVHVVGDAEVSGHARVGGTLEVGESATVGTSLSVGASVTAAGPVSGASGSFGPLACASLSAGGASIPLPGWGGSGGQTFVTGDGRTVTVVNGIIVSVT